MTKKENNRDVKSLSFEVVGKPIGNSCYILVPKSLRGKRLKVSIHVIED